MPQKSPRMLIPKYAQRIAALYQLKIIDSTTKTQMVELLSGSLTSGDMTEFANYVKGLNSSHKPLLDEFQQWIQEDISSINSI